MIVVIDVFPDKESCKQIFNEMCFLSLLSWEFRMKVISLAKPLPQNEGKSLVTTCIPAWSARRNVSRSLVQPHACNKG